MLHFSQMTDEQQARDIQSEGQDAAFSGTRRGLNPYRNAISWMRDAWWAGYDEECERAEGEREAAEARHTEWAHYA